MSNTLIVRRHPLAQDQLEWLLSESTGSNGGSTPQQGTLEQFADTSKGNRVVLLVSGKALLLTEVKLPEGSQRTLASALPYALEERLVEDVNNLHIVAAPRQSDGKTPVAVIQQHKLTGLLNDFASAGVEPYWLAPEPLALPWSKGVWSLLFEDSRVVVRTGEFSGLECAPDMLRPLLIRIRSEQIATSTMEQLGEFGHPLNLYGDMPDPVLAGQLEAEGFTLNYFSGPALPVLTHFGNKRSAINLLQGFTVGNNLAGSKANWWPAAIMLLLSFAIYMGTSGYQYWMLHQQELAKQEQLIRLFKESFPDVKRIVDPLQQAKQRLDQRRVAYGQGEDNLLTLLYRAGQALQKDRALEFQTVEFREGVLQLRMKGKSVESIEQFKQHIEANQTIVVEILSTVVQGKGIEARLKIKGRTS